MLLSSKSGFFSGWVDRIKHPIRSDGVLGARIVRRILFVSVGFSVATIVSLAVVQFSQQRIAVNRDVDRIIATIVPAVEEAVWQINRGTILTLSQSISNLNAIASITVKTEFGEFAVGDLLMAKAGKCARQISVELTSQRYVTKLQASRIGEIVICQIEHSLANTVGTSLMLGSPVLLVLLISFPLVVLAGLQRSIISPLNELRQAISTNHTKRYQLHRDEQDRGDEIDMVVDELERLTQRLANERDIAETTLFSINSGIFILNNRMEVTRVNIAGSHLLGIERHAIVGRHFDQIIRSKAFEPLSQGSPSGETSVYKLNGATTVELRQSKICTADNAQIGYVAILSDVTELHRMQSFILQSEKVEAIGALTSGVAHDFNNLLSVIIGNLELYAIQSDIDIEHCPPLNTIMSSCSRAATLTDSLLSYSRRQNLESQLVSIDTVFSDLKQLLDHTIPSRITLSLCNFSECGLFVDPTYLQTALLNLAINARDALGRSSGRIVISADDGPLGGLKKPLKAGEKYITLSVKDNGQGMDEATLKRAIEPFFTTKEAGKGTGLGLSMVFGFAEQSGGLVQIESAPRQGTTVFLTLPAVSHLDVAKAPRSSPYFRKLDTIEKRPLQALPLRVFLVEDNPDVREVTKAALEKKGHHVFAFSSYKQAVASSHHLIKCDLLLTDFQLPDGDGLLMVKLAQQLKPKLPAIVMSGDIPMEMARQVNRVSGVCLLLKPFTLSELSERIYQVSTETQLAGADQTAKLT